MYKYTQVLTTVICIGFAKLGQIQGGGLQRAIQDSTKGGGRVAIFFSFYALKIELFRVFTLSD